MLLLAPVACSDDDPSGAPAPSAGCGEVQRERLDPDSLVHLLPGADEPAYLTDPPTSGPHAPTAPVGGQRTEPVGRSEQVGLLEAGLVIVQHDGSLAEDDLAFVEGLADPEAVLVAPGADLPAPIIATAWTRKLACSSTADGGEDALTDFVATQARQAPGTDG